MTAIGGDCLIPPWQARHARAELSGDTFVPPDPITGDGKRYQLKRLLPSPRARNRTFGMAPTRAQANVLLLLYARVNERSLASPRARVVGDD